MEYLNLKEISELWGISKRRIRTLCSEGRVQGAIKQGRNWVIPRGTFKPIDGRHYRNLLIENSYKSLLLQIDSKCEAIKKIRKLTQGESEKLREDFLIEYTYNSNAIEGSTLTLQETALVLEGVTIDQKPLKEHLEAIGHKEAYLYVENVVKDNTPISEKIIKEIHSLVLSSRHEDRGVFRKIQVKIMGTNFETSNPLNIGNDIDNLLKTYKGMRTHHIIEKVAYFHREFERIHPFIDGNGRTGRLLLNMELMKNHYPAINIKYTDRRKYYESFDRLDKMTELIANYVDGELTKIIGAIKAA